MELYASYALRHVSSVRQLVVTNVSKESPDTGLEVCGYDLVLSVLVRQMVLPRPCAADGIDPSLWRMVLTVFVRPMVLTRLADGIDMPLYGSNLY